MSNKNKNACMFCLKSPALHPGISLHSFPSDTKIRRLWLTACGIQEEDFKHNFKLCSLHFEENCFKSGTIRRFLKPGSIPTKLSRRTKSFFESGSFCKPGVGKPPPAKQFLMARTKVADPYCKQSSAYLREVQLDHQYASTSSTTKSFFESGSFCKNSSANLREVQLDHQYASTSSTTKSFFESGSFCNLSSANSREVQPDDQDASTSTNFKVSSTEVCNAQVSSCEAFNTEMPEDSNTITPERKRRTCYIGDIKPADLCTPEGAQVHFNNAKLKILNNRKRIKVLNQKVNRLNKKLSSMADLIAHLKSQNQITKETHNIILVNTENIFNRCIVIC